jgi:hypothetical protein
VGVVVLMVPPIRVLVRLVERRESSGARKQGAKRAPHASDR